jgi:hypothetical protein
LPPLFDLETCLLPSAIPSSPKLVKILPGLCQFVRQIAVGEMPSKSYIDNEFILIGSKPE